MSDREIIEKLQKENETIKEILNTMISCTRRDGTMDFGFNTLAKLEDLNRQLNECDISYRKGKTNE